MQAIHVPLIETKADKRRAAAVKSAEENFVRKETPRFFVEGLGACRTGGDPDDFTDQTRRKSGYEARARAGIVCGACPFSVECVAWAIDSGQTGVFGGEWLREGKVVEAIRYA
jgi:transcription factor WhiB